VDLKAETVGLAVALELPLVICDIQRAGPSTGMPTKTEQSDLLLVMFGRHGEAPVPVIAAQSPADCFDAALEAVRMATTYRTPVYLLSDAYLANGSEPWLIPNVEGLPDMTVEFAKPVDDGEAFAPYARDPLTLARPWAIPGTPGLEHRIGGIEKENVSGDISYDPANHDTMVRLRQAKIDGIANSIPLLAVDDPTDDAELLVLGWGSTYGSIAAAVRLARDSGHKVARAHLRHLSPLPANTGDVLHHYPKVLLPELNLGQLALILRGKFLVDIASYSQLRGLPFHTEDLLEAIEGMLSS
jgi:2-oxoglutarate ferredoxin oxidoreductase subunit alpha